MTDKNNLDFPDASASTLENALSEAGRYFRSFLKPALAEGFSALESEKRLLLIQIYFHEDPFGDDDVLLADYLNCSIPEARILKHQALGDLALIIRNRTGILLSRQLLPELLRTASNEERAIRTLDKNAYQASPDHSSVAGFSLLFHFVLTANFLCTRAARLFSERIYQINWIRTASPGTTFKDYGVVDKSNRGNLPDGIPIKTTASDDVRIELIVDKKKHIHLLATFTERVPEPPRLRVSWPTHRELQSPMIPISNSDLPDLAWRSIGYIDTAGCFVLRIDGGEGYSINPDDPISFSCVVHSSGSI